MTASATQTVRGDGETDEINFCLVRVIPVAQPCVSDDRLQNGFHMCPFFSFFLFLKHRFARGQRAFRVVPVSLSAWKCADIRALHFKPRDRGG